MLNQNEIFEVTIFEVVHLQVPMFIDQQIRIKK